MKKRLSVFLEWLKKLTFYKKKTFYVILTVLFSLILLADVGVAVFVPAQSMNIPDMENGFPYAPGYMDENGEMTRPEREESG
ncbi:MAG: hypothetical protein ACI4TF_11580, partial [Oliverpabstia sp.]